MPGLVRKLIRSLFCGGRKSQCNTVCSSKDRRSAGCCSGRRRARHQSIDESQSSSSSSDDDSVYGQGMSPCQVRRQQRRQRRAQRKMDRCQRKMDKWQRKAERRGFACPPQRLIKQGDMVQVDASSPDINSLESKKAEQREVQPAVIPPPPYEKHANQI